ncbi:MAG: zinc-binding dehydrogenase [Actinomycetes bacterium]
MQAWQVQGAGDPAAVLRRVELAVPEPGPGEIRIRVAAAAVGMPDVFLCRGTYAFVPPLPFVPGQEVYGTVDGVGVGVDGLGTGPGARVMAVTNFFDGRGGLAEFAIARAESAFRVPDAMASTDAAGFRIGCSTAWVGLVRRGGLTAGEILLVLGAAGGSGAAAVALGHALGARVVAVVSDDAKAALCRSLGADVVVDRTTTVVPDAVLAATDGHGADVVYDPVGGEAAAATVDCLARDGRLLAVGFASGAWAAPDLWQVVRRNASVVGVYAGGYTRAEHEADHEALCALVARGALPLATRVVGFDAVPAALTEVAAGRAVGKTVVQVAGP